VADTNKIDGRRARELWRVLTDGEEILTKKRRPGGLPQVSTTPSGKSGNDSTQGEKRKHHHHLSHDRRASYKIPYREVVVVVVPTTRSRLREGSR